MVYTITFNPAVDYVMRIGKITAGIVNRSESEEIYFGGKGINVSIVLNELGVKSTALGFVAGFTGKAIESGLSEAGIKTDFIFLKSGYSRINVKIKSTEETDINGRGPDIPEEAIDELLKKLKEIKDGDTLVLAGSVPKSLPENIYEKILEEISDRKIKIVVDAEKDLLLNALKYKPFLVKPNSRELGDMFGVSLETKEEINLYARKLKEMGAQNVLVSMAGDGALLIEENGETHICGVCRGEVKNSVGAGDSMVAGFIAGSENGDYEYALKLGTAAGGATTFSEGIGKREEILGLLKQLG